MKQTVVFDCCHSGSGTRTNISDPTRLARVVDVPARVPTELDQRIWHDSLSIRDINTTAGFLQRGMQSHVLLAACGAQELALEDQGRGVFTHALLFLLTRIGADQIRYRDVLERIYDLPEYVSERSNDVSIDLASPHTGKIHNVKAIIRIGSSSTPGCTVRDKHYTLYVRMKTSIPWKRALHMVLPMAPNLLCIKTQNFPHEMHP
jgi:hypothetical protein